MVFGDATAGLDRGLEGQAGRRGGLWPRVRRNDRLPGHAGAGI